MVPENGYGNNADGEQNAEFGGRAGDDVLIVALASILQSNVPSEPSPARIAMLRDTVAAEAVAAQAIAAEAIAAEAIAAEAASAPPHRRITEPPSLDDRRAARPAVGRRTRMLAAVAAAAVLLAGGALLGSVLARDYPSTGGEVEYVGAIASDEGDVAGELEVVKIGIGRVVSLDTFDLPILPTSEYYEVWFVAPDDSPETPNRISAGTFHPDADGRSEVTFAAAVDPAKYPVVEITAEPGDGDPSPTGPVVMRVQIVE